MCELTVKRGFPGEEMKCHEMREKPYLAFGFQVEIWQSRQR